MPQQPLLIPTALLLLIALFWRQWKSLLFNLPALIVCLLLLGVNLPLHRATGAGMPVRVMTWNVHQLAGGLHAINAAIKHEAPDIVLLQEVRRLPLLAESPVMQQAFPGWFMAKSGEVAILSRYPITRETVCPIVGTERVILKVCMEVNGTPITIIVVHYSTSMDQQSLAHTPSQRVYLRQTAAIRSRQTDTLLDVAAHADTPVIIAGDFNTPPRGLIYRRITSVYQDTFRAAGFGTGYTFPASFPMLRIDHIFTSHNIGIQSCRTIDSSASDHLPQIAVMLLKKSK